MGNVLVLHMADIGLIPEHCWLWFKIKTNKKMLRDIVKDGMFYCQKEGESSLLDKGKKRKRKVVLKKIFISPSKRHGSSLLHILCFRSIFVYVIHAHIYIISIVLTRKFKLIGLKVLWEW